MELETIINVFSYWMLSQSKTVLDGQNKQLWSTDVTKKIIGTVCDILESRKDFGI